MDKNTNANQQNDIQASQNNFVDLDTVELKMPEEGSFNKEPESKSSPTTALIIIGVMFLLFAVIAAAVWIFRDPIINLIFPVENPTSGFTPVNTEGTTTPNNNESEADTATPTSERDNNPAPNNSTNSPISTSTASTSIEIEANANGDSNIATTTASSTTEISTNTATSTNN